MRLARASQLRRKARVNSPRHSRRTSTDRLRELWELEFGNWALSVTHVSTAEPDDVRMTDAAATRHFVARHVGGSADALNLELELVEVARPAQGLLERHESLLIQTKDGLVERLHPVLRGAGRNGAVDHRRLVLVHDAIADEGGRDHHFDRGDAAQTVGARHEALRDGRFQHAGQLDAHLPLLVRWKDGDDAVDRLRRVESVERG